MALFVISGVSTGCSVVPHTWLLNCPLLPTPRRRSPRASQQTLYLMAASLIHLLCPGDQWQRCPAAPQLWCIPVFSQTPACWCLTVQPPLQTWALPLTRSSSLPLVQTSSRVSRERVWPCPIPQPSVSMNEDELPDCGMCKGNLKLSPSGK